MKRKATALTAIAAILFCCCAAASAEATSMPAAAPTIGEAASAAPPPMTQLIATIRNAKDVATAATSYARARTLDKEDVELYETYMKKMLTLGHPKIAAYPAMELRRLQAKNGTAWGVVGYNDAKRGRYFLALTSTIQGMALLPDDPGIQHNAGVLLAWYQTRSLKPKLSRTLQALLKEGSQKWLEKAKYAEAHSKSKSQFTALAERIEKLKAEIAPAEKAANTAARESSRAAAKYRDYGRKIVRLQNETKVLLRTLATAEHNRALATLYERYEYDRLVYRTRSRIRSNETKMRSLQKNSDELRKEAVEKTRLYKETNQTLAKAKTALKAEEKIRPSLSWLPPAVDGVITPEAEKSPTFTVHAQPASQPSAGSSAKTQLKMAKLLLQNNRTQKAMAILKSIVKKYPDTEAAKEAAELLKKLKADGPRDL